MFSRNNVNSGNEDSNGLVITNEDISRLTSAKVFLLDVLSDIMCDSLILKPPSRINSLDYFHTGESLIVANDDGTLLLCDPLEGRLKMKIYAKKYGMGNVHFVCLGSDPGLVVLICRRIIRQPWLVPQR